MTSTAYLVLFNCSEGEVPSESERAKLASFYVPRGCVPELLDDERVFRALTSGAPCIGIFEDERDGQLVVAAFAEAKQRRWH